MGDFDRLWAKLEAWKGIPLPLPGKGQVSLITGKLAAYGQVAQAIARQTLTDVSVDEKGTPQLTDVGGDMALGEWATILVAANQPRPTAELVSLLAANFLGASPAPKRQPSQPTGPSAERAATPTATTPTATTRHTPAPATEANARAPTQAKAEAAIPTDISTMSKQDAVSLFELLQEQRAEMQRQREEHAHQSERLWDHIAELRREKEASQQPPSPDRADSHAQLAENDRLRLSLEFAKSSPIFDSRAEHDMKFRNLPLDLRARLPQYRVLKTQEATAQLCYAAIAKVKETREKWHAATVDGLRAKLDNKWPKFVCLQLALALEMLEDTSGTSLPEFLFVAECLVASTMPQLDAVISARVLPETSVLASTNAPLMPAPKAEPRAAQPPQGGRAPCIDFARGACRRGADCRFPHEVQKN
jgi:hypothetical protein